MGRRQTCYLEIFCAENCIKIKEIRQGRMSLAPPLPRSANDYDVAENPGIQ